jgi:hypothetical protein
LGEPHAVGAGAERELAGLGEGQAAVVAARGARVPGSRTLRQLLWVDLDARHGALTAARGLAEIIADRKTQVITVRPFLDFFRSDFLGVPRLVVIFALVAVGGWILLNRTAFGRRTIAVGGNPEAARLAGINVKRHTTLLYVLLGLACGIAAVMLMARTTAGTSTHGQLLELDAIAAVVIGGTLLSGGRGTIVGTVFGVLIFTTLTNVFTLNNLDSSSQAVAKGAIIVIAVIGIVNTLGLSVIERTREIGLLRAIGMSRPQLRRMVTLESVAVAVLARGSGPAVRAPQASARGHVHRSSASAPRERRFDAQQEAQRNPAQGRSRCSPRDHRGSG